MPFDILILSSSSGLLLSHFPHPSKYPIHCAFLRLGPIFDQILQSWAFELLLGCSLLLSIVCKVTGNHAVALKVGSFGSTRILALA